MCKLLSDFRLSPEPLQCEETVTVLIISGTLTRALSVPVVLRPQVIMFVTDSLSFALSVVSGHSVLVWWLWLWPKWSSVTALLSSKLLACMLKTWIISWIIEWLFYSLTAEVTQKCANMSAVISLIYSEIYSSMPYLKGQSTAIKHNSVSVEWDLVSLDTVFW